MMKPYGPFSECGRENCRLCNPVPVRKDDSDWPTVVIAAAISILFSILVLVGTGVVK